VRSTRIFIAIFLAFVLASATGCAWQRIPAMPQYAVEDPIPLNIGIVLANSQASTTYGPLVISDWKESRLFESLTYPYRDGDPVDAVMELSIDGGWKGSGAGAGFVIGLTLGLAGTFLGPSMTGTHIALAIINDPAHELGRYSIEATTKVTWGMAANNEQVSRKADALQVRNIASELANKIRSDRQTLLSVLKE
jgi:hypothetical protein